MFENILVDDDRTWSESTFTDQTRNRFLYTLCVILLVVFIKLYIIDVAFDFQDAIENNKLSTNDANAGLKSLTEIATVEELPNVTYSMHYTDPITGGKSATKCSDGGLYLGESDLYRDCSQICGSDDWSYRYFDKDSFLYRYLRANRPGAYCISRGVARTNPYTATIVHNVYGWGALPKWRNIFGGNHGTDIVCCNGRMTDMSTGIDYVGHIPYNLPVSDPETETIDTQLRDLSFISQTAYKQHTTPDKGAFVSGYKHPRFVCTDELVRSDTGEVAHKARAAIVVDENNNAFVPAPDSVSRFQRVRNECGALLNSAAPTVRPDYGRGMCTCIRGIHSTPGPKEGDEGLTSTVIARPEHTTREDERAIVSMARSYQRHFERGRFNRDDVPETISQDNVFDQPYVCSQCPYGFVQTDKPGGTGIIRTLIKSEPTDSMTSTPSQYLSIPVRCHSVVSTNIWAAGADNSIHSICGYDNVTSSDNTDMGADGCTNLLIDVSTDSSAFVRTILSKLAPT